MAVPHDLSDFTLHVGDEHTSEAWEPRDAGQRVLNNTACTTSRAAWIAPWLLLVLGHSVQVLTTTTMATAAGAGDPFTATSRRCII